MALARGWLDAKEAAQARCPEEACQRSSLLRNRINAEPLASLSWDDLGVVAASARRLATGNVRRVKFNRRAPTQLASAAGEGRDHSTSPLCNTARGRQIRSALRRRRSSIEKLGNGRDKLHWRERLGQEDAVGYATGWLFGCIAAGHIDNWEFRVDFSGSLRDFPTVHYAAQLDVGHKRSIFALDAL